jgi:hypothetical protein
MPPVPAPPRAAPPEHRHRRGDRAARRGRPSRPRSRLVRRPGHRGGGARMVPPAIASRCPDNGSCPGHGDETLFATTPYWPICSSRRGSWSAGGGPAARPQEASHLLARQQGSAAGPSSCSAPVPARRWVAARSAAERACQAGGLRHAAARTGDPAASSCPRRARRFTGVQVGGGHSRVLHQRPHRHMTRAGCHAR